MRRIGLGTLALVATTTIGSNASGFAEDVCFPEGGGAARNCSTLPDACLPAGTDGAACRVAATAAFTIEGAKTTGARSVVHADATHLFAQAVGFSAEQAYWIAAYDEVADYGKFAPYDVDGQPFGGGALDTVELDGFVRTSFGTGGMLFHFNAPYNGGAATPPAGVDGLHPHVDEPMTETFLAHVRAWAMAGDAGLACAGGLTLASAAGDYGTGDACFSEGGAAATIEVNIAAVGKLDAPYKIDSGPQVISKNGGGDPIFVDAFEATVGAARAADARLGIYLHALADRVSHHVCGDTSVLSGPEGGFYYDMSSDDCQQGYHALRHMWETGIDFGVLAPKDRTTEAGLGVVYDELAAFAKARGVLTAGADAAAARDAAVAAILPAMQVADADARIRAIAKLACAEGHAPFPGMPACDTPDGGAGGGGPGGAGQGGAAHGGAGQGGAAHGGAAQGGSGPGGAGTTAGGAATPAGGEAEEDSGCATAPGGPRRASLAAVAIALGLAALRRRRR